MARVGKRGRKAMPKLRRAPVAPQRSSAEHLDLVMRAVNEGVYDWDIVGGTIYYSEGVRRATGMSPKDMRTPQDWRKRIHPEDLPNYDAALIAHFKGTSERFECDYRFRAKDGKWCWARQHGIAMRDAKGRAVRMVGSTGDITAQKRAEQELAESRERLTLATQAATEGIYDWDIEAGTLYLSDRAKEFFTLAGKRFTPKSWNARIHKEDYPAYREAVLRCLKGKTPRVELEYRIRSAAASWTWILDRGIAVRNAQGRATRLVGAISDITSRRAAAEELRRAHAEATEALERQTATAEILKVIARSPSDVQPVFEAIAHSAVRLVGGHSCSVTRVLGDQLHLVALTSTDSEADELVRSHYPMPLGGRTPMLNVLRTAKTLLVRDTEEDPLFPEDGREVARARGFRTIVFVPMLRDGAGIGVIHLAGVLPNSLTDGHVRMLETFADQAVIAIENTRLFNETKEALERQTATAEILEVISSSPTDTQPVFEAIADACQRLFPDHENGINLLDARGGLYLSAARSPSAEALRRHFEAAPTRRKGTEVRLRRTVAHYPDVRDAGVPEEVRLGCEVSGVGSIVYAPLVLEGKGIGSLWVARKATGAFADKEISLLKTFADQAVIALQNARLFNETREALERQTAISEILRVISDSPSDVQPVLDAVAIRAARICDAKVVDIVLREGESLRVAATFGELGRPLGMLVPLNRETVMGRSIVDGKPVQVADLQSVEGGFALGRELAVKYGHRSILAVPLMREGRALGTILVRRAEVRPFDEKHVALLQTFADQAAIAIENVRLFNETREALERQTATADVLAAMSGAMTDPQPVFDRIVKNVRHLFHTRFAVLQLRRGDMVEMPAADGEGGFERLRERYPRPLDDSTVGGVAMLSKMSFQMCPVRDNPAAPPGTVQFAKDFGFDSLIFSPMILEGEVIGAIGAARPEAIPFDERQIALIKTFADQAVIAIENVRLFNETKEALERQTATAEILKVIASSPSDVQPVFDAIARSALQLIGGRSAVVVRRDGEYLHLAAHTATTETGDDAMKKSFPTRMTGRGFAGKAVLSGVPVEVNDIETDTSYSSEFREGARARGVRSALSVPMLRDGEGIGAINVWRSQPGRFTDHQTNLLKTFADQAVIAIENVRLFNETKEALERQTATAEVLRVISGSPTSTQPVFDAILERATKLCDAPTGILFRYADGAFSALATRIPDPKFAAGYKEPLRPRPDSKTGLGRLRRGEHLVHIPDMMNDAAYAEGDPIRMQSIRGGMRSWLGVPLLKDNEMVGALVIYSGEPRSFSEQQISLLQTFAEQAVIAIENVRLFNELQQRIGQMSALREVGQAISSTLDLEQVLQTIVSHAVQLTGLDSGTIYEFDAASESFHLRATTNMPEEMINVYRAMPIRLGESVVGRAGATREPVEVPDIEDGSYQARYKDVLLRHGYRAILAVPLLREEQVIGAITVSRNSPGAFAPEVIELLKTFASQSAMAIQNARLFREIAEKGKQLELASEHKSQFLASMSHELRTPLNAILGFNEMIIDEVYGEVSPDVKAPLENIQTSGKHLLRLINNVLDLAKIEAGRMELSLADYAVQDTVASVHATLQPLAAGKGLELVVGVPEDIPLAYGDPGRLAQCLMNLAGNSLKFTKEGRVEISVAEKDGLLTWRVVDTGIGIPPDKIDTLFTEFKQTDATIASEYGGTGLGLSITKKFIEMHGGRIWIESELGKGSTFLFEIPLRVSS